jgi:glycosyltransferase involved in cell wall biosynthesis
VTVVIPTIAGREQLLARALASVAVQQVAPARVIVQLDRDRLGAAATRNAGLAQVATDWVAWLDDDDELLPNHLKVLVRAANQTRAELVFSYPEVVGGRDPLACVDDRGVLIAEPLHVPFGPVQRVALRQCGNFIPVTYLVRTEPVRRVGGFPEPYSMPDVKVSADCEDYLLLLKLLDAKTAFHHVCGVRTWRYHLHDGNLGGRGLNRLHELEEGPS